MTDLEPFDAQSADQLRALGFKFEGDKHIALLRGDVIVSVVRHRDQPDLFVLTITVPKGVTFSAFMRREDLLDAYRIRETCGGAP
jgi:hypothetical protein